MTVYKKVPFEMNGVRRGILCEGPQGPSALVAVYNILAIRHTSVYGEEGPIDEETVKGLIRGTLKIAFRKLASSGSSRSAAVSSKAIKTQVSGAIDGLPTRLDVVPLPSGAMNFEVNDLYMLFSHLGIDLMHGWVLDPGAASASVCEAFKGFSTAKQVVEYFASLEAAGRLKDAETTTEEDDMAVVRGLLGAAAHQLTAYGHSSLVAKVEEGDFAVVYCHSRFSVVHKHDGELFVLETDEEVRSRFPQVVWRLLDQEVQGDSVVYLTGQFTPVKGQPNIAKAREWIQEKLRKKMNSAGSVATDDGGDVGTPTHGSDRTSSDVVEVKTLVTKGQLKKAQRRSAKMKSQRG